MMKTHSGIATISHKFLLALLLSIMALGGCDRGKDSTDLVTNDNASNDIVTIDEVRSIAKDAYIYGFPMVMNYKTIYNYVIDESHPEYKGPFNELSCVARLFTPDDRAVVTPNADTPYCMYWVDLRAEPMVISLPDVEDERYYSFQLIDLYTHNIAYLGTLTTGNGEAKYLLAGKDWQGDKPEGVTGVIRSETDLVFNIVRTQLFGPDDLTNVIGIQESYKLQALSAYLGTEEPAVAEHPAFPEWIEGAQFDERFFTYLDFMLRELKQPGDGEADLWSRLSSIGIGAEAVFDLDALSAEVREALKYGVADGFSEFEAFIAKHSNDPLASAKLFGTRDFLKESAKKNYQLDSPDILRSVAAHMGLYGNSVDEAIYPTYLVDADQQPLDASSNNYTLTFEKGSYPPVRAFWSLTMYDGQTQLFIENSLERYLLNSTMLDQFKIESDGSLVLYISRESPGSELEANWLPAPDGPFYVVLRLYGPEQEAKDGSWLAPQIEKSTHVKN